MKKLLNIIILLFSCHVFAAQINVNIHNNLGSEINSAQINVRGGGKDNWVNIGDVEVGDNYLTVDTFNNGVNGLFRGYIGKKQINTEYTRKNNGDIEVTFNSNSDGKLLDINEEQLKIGDSLDSNDVSKEIVEFKKEKSGWVDSWDVSCVIGNLTNSGGGVACSGIWTTSLRFIGPIDGNVIYIPVSFGELYANYDKDDLENNYPLNSNKVRMSGGVDPHNNKVLGVTLYDAQSNAIIGLIRMPFSLGIIDSFYGTGGFF